MAHRPQKYFCSAWFQVRHRNVALSVAHLWHMRHRMCAGPTCRPWDQVHLAQFCGAPWLVRHRKPTFCGAWCLVRLTESCWGPPSMIDLRQIWPNSVAHRGWCATETQLSVAHGCGCATESWISVAHQPWCATESSLSVAHLQPCATEK